MSNIETVQYEDISSISSSFIFNQNDEDDFSTIDEMSEFRDDELGFSFDPMIDDF